MENAIEILQRIGDRLDNNIFPKVMNGGFVMPNEVAVPTPAWAKENENERSGTRRSAAESWTGATGRERSANGHRASSSAPPLIGASLQVQYENEVEAVLEAYPGTLVWHQKEGMWLLTETNLFHGLWQKAVILIGIPFDRRRVLRSWGFWVGPPLLYPMWIGPRHTNCPDGSICAFEPMDGTWHLGDSLVTLLDLYTVWTLRHLHLQVFKRWPGPQSARHAYERLTEFTSTEHCGCGSGRYYGDCCQEKDIRSNLVVEAMIYFRQGFGVRKVPELVTTFIQHQNSPPAISDLLPRTEMSYDGTITYSS